MALDDNAKNAMLDHLGTLIDLAALYTADPDPSDGASNEVAGGSPAYARKAIGWAAAATGSMSKDGTSVVFDVPGSTTVTHVGFFDATGPTWMGSGDVTDEVFGGQGTYTLTDATISIT